MKKFNKRRFFKRQQRATGCGKCAGCKFRNECKKKKETGEDPCNLCYYYDVCDAEFKTALKEGEQNEEVI